MLPWDGRSQLIIKNQHMFWLKKCKKCASHHPTTHARSAPANIIGTEEGTLSVRFLVFFLLIFRMGADDPDWEAIGTQHAP